MNDCFFLFFLLCGCLGFRLFRQPNLISVEGAETSKFMLDSWRLTHQHDLLQ